MTLAALPMYDFPELRWATDALWSAIASRLPSAPADLVRGQPLHAVWSDPALLLAQTCGYPLVTSLAGKVRLVATPMYRAEGCEGALYRSAVIVRAEDGAGSLTDLRGRRCAVNGEDSNSGMNVLRAAIAPLAGGAGRFFADVAMTGGHAASVAAVAHGDADVAAIDGVTWAHLQRWRPGETGRVRVLCWSAATPGLPLITSFRSDATKIGALTRALMDVAADRSLLAVREALLLEGFEVLPRAAYDAVLALERAAQAMGYGELR